MESIAEIKSSLELKSSNEIKNLSKGDAINYSLNITQAYTKLFDVLFDEDQGIIVRQQKQMEAQAATSKLLISKIEKLEKQQIRSDQYSRKETIDMKGINPELPDREVEKKVLKVLNSIKSETDQPFTPEDIHACRKLKNKKIVICKFVSRRRMRANINNRSKLKGKDLTSIGIRDKVVIYESMTHHFKNLNWRCNQLKKAGIIKDCWFYNGKYKIVKPDATPDPTPDIVDNISDVSSVTGVSVDDITKICEEWQNKPFLPRHNRKE